MWHVYSDWLCIDQSKSKKQKEEEEVEAVPLHINTEEEDEEEDEERQLGSRLELGASSPVTKTGAAVAECLNSLQ